MTEGCQELSWILKLMVDVGVQVPQPVPVYEDNQSCINLVQNGKTERTKHIETKFFYVRDLHDKKKIIIKYCPTEDMLADLLTKPLAACRQKKLCEGIGLLPR